MRMATALSYQTLLAVVPLLVLALSLLTYMDAFYTFQEDIGFFLFENFLPATIAQAYGIIQDIVLNAQKLTYIGLAGLALTTLLLFSNIETCFAQIWQVKANRHMASRFISYLLLVLLGPIAISTSVTLFKWLARLTEKSTGLSLQIYSGYFSFLAPFSLYFLVLFLLYRLVPAKKVRALHAAAGAAIAASLFVASKYLFKLYLVYFPSYQALYGALAILPLFLIWLYLTWVLILLGGTVTAVMGFRTTADSPTAPTGQQDDASSAPSA